MNNFDLIAGYEREKEELKKICDILNNREYYLNKGATMPKGLIFYGGAGTGKTLFTRVLSMECNLPLNVINFGKSVNDNSILKQIKKAFDKAKKSQKLSIVYIDELDKILPDMSREYISDHSKIILTQLLTLIDGIDNNSNVFFVASCNNYGCIPETMVRPGRIDKKIMLNNPDLSSRKDIINYYINKTNCTFNINLKDIAEATNGFSCAGLQTLVNECVLNSNKNNVVSSDLMYQKIREINNQDIERKKSEAEKELISCHNLGHFLVAKEFDDGDYLINFDSNICNKYFEGLLSTVEDDDDYDDEEEDYDDDYYDDEEDETSEVNSYYTYKDYENLITVLFGGMVAEEIVYGHSFNHLYHDLSNIEDLLFKASYNGLLGIEYYYDDQRNDILTYSQNFTDKLNDKFFEIKTKCLNKAREILTKNINQLKILQDALLREGVLNKETVEEILKGIEINENN